MLDPETLAELLAERRLEREAILEHGLVADLRDVDGLGRLLLRFGAALDTDDLVWLCTKPGEPEYEARVETHGIRRLGVLTGRARPCPAESWN